MKSILTNIVLTVICLTASLLFASSGAKDVSAIVSLQSHANKLVRENNFEGSQYFFEKAFKMVDSLKSSGTSERLQADSLELTLIRHYENFNRVLVRLEHNLGEDKVFYFHRDDIDYDHVSPLREGMADFPFHDNKKVRKYLKYYTGRARKSAAIYLERSQLYLADIKKIFRMYGISEDLAFLPLVESGFDPFAHSYAGASGLWQFVQSTGKIFDLRKDWWVDDRKDVLKSTVAAARFLRLLYQDYGDWYLALAAYNCGQGGLNRRIRSHKSRNFWSLYRLPRQTKEYVPRFIALNEVAGKPLKYGFDVYAKEKVQYDTVQLDSCVNLAAVARAAFSSYREIKKLNPQLRQWCLPPYAKDYAILIPALGKLGFRERFGQLADSLLYYQEDYLVKRGDTLKKIADLFKVDAAGIADLNGFGREVKLVAGVVIMVPRPPLREKWFTEFNNRYLSYYDGEKYYLDGRKQIRYRVRSGDSVWKIAKKFKVSRSRLKGWNKIGSNNKIIPGQRLVIYL